MVRQAQHEWFSTFALIFQWDFHASTDPQPTFFPRSP